MFTRIRKESFRIFRLQLGGGSTQALSLSEMPFSGVALANVVPIPIDIVSESALFTDEALFMPN